MKKIALVFGFALLLFAALGSNPAVAQTSAQAGASYFVRANGNDANNGTAENTPFKTLAKAVEAASKSTIKKITVIGTLAGQTTIKNSGSDEILITGKTGASESEKAVLTTIAGNKDERRPIQIEGKSNIKLECITVTTNNFYSVIYIGGDKGKAPDTKLTLGKDAVVFSNLTADGTHPNYGGGILAVYGTLVMLDNAMVTKSVAGAGGGIAIQGSTLIMQGNAVISNNIATSDDFDSGGGGGIYSLNDGNIILKDNARVTGNTANHGGGILMRMSGLETPDGKLTTGSGVYENKYVTGNTATGKFLSNPGGDNIRVHNQ